MRKVLSVLLVICLWASSFTIISASGQEKNFLDYYEAITSCIPKDAYEYAQTCSEEVVNMISMNENIDNTTLMEVSVGEPFAIAKIDESEQNEIYYFPIVDEDGLVIIVMSIMNTNKGWRMSADEEMVEELNIINYTEDEFIFYIIDEKLYVENMESIHVFENDKITELTLGNISENEKWSNCLQKIEEATTYNMIEYNAQGQNTDKICWAASAATITNYLLGTSYTAYNACDIIGHSYEGGTISDKQSVLSAYGITYNNIQYSQMSFSNIQNNIANKKPIAVSSTNGGTSSHAVTCYGYFTSPYYYVYFWNSGLNGGAGGTQYTTFYSSGTVYSYNNDIFEWCYTLSYY